MVWGTPALLFERLKLSCLVNDRVRIPRVTSSSLVLATYWVWLFPEFAEILKPPSP